MYFGSWSHHHVCCTWSLWFTWLRYHGISGCLVDEILGPTLIWTVMSFLIKLEIINIGKLSTWTGFNSIELEFILFWNWLCISSFMFGSHDIFSIVLVNVIEEDLTWTDVTLVGWFHFLQFHQCWSFTFHVNILCFC